MFLGIVTGTDKITESKKYLKSSVDNYSQALGTAHIRISVKAYELLQGSHPLTQLTPSNSKVNSTTNPRTKSRCQNHRPISTESLLHRPRELPLGLKTKIPHTESNAN